MAYVTQLRIVACGLAWAVCSATVSAQSTAVFGHVQRGSARFDITWSAAPHSAVNRAALRLTAGEQRTVIRSATLPLRVLHLYDVVATMRRGPGTRNECWLAYNDGQGVRHTWAPVWQLPASARPNWLPLSPRSQTYTQGFVLPADATDAHLELAIDPVQQPQLARYALWELTELAFIERAAVACCHELGPNRLLGGDMQTPGGDGLPRGWTLWSGQAAVRRAPDEPRQRSVLHVRANQGAVVAATVELAVVRGTAWQLSVWARGRGQLDMLAHALNADLPIHLRVGAPQSVNYSVDQRAWRRFDALWFAEAPGVQFAQVVLSITASSDFELSAVEFRPYRR